MENLILNVISLSLATVKTVKDTFTMTRQQTDIFFMKGRKKPYHIPSIEFFLFLWLFLNLILSMHLS